VALDNVIGPVGGWNQADGETGADSVFSGAVAAGVGVGGAAGGRRHSREADAVAASLVCRDLDGAESAVAIQFFDREAGLHGSYLPRHITSQTLVAKVKRQMTACDIIRHMFSPRFVSCWTPLS